MKKWKLTDIAQFLVASMPFGRISNILEEIDFRLNSKDETYIDARQNFASIKSNSSVKLRETHCHAGLDRELSWTPPRK